MQSHVKPASGAEGRNNATPTEISTQKLLKKINMVKKYLKKHVFF